MLMVNGRRKNRVSHSSTTIPIPNQTIPYRVDSAERYSHRTTVAGLVDKAATAALPAGVSVTSVVGQGHSLDDAVLELDFQDSEIVLVGSSRLAQPKRLKEQRPH